MLCKSDCGQFVENLLTSSDGWKEGKTEGKNHWKDRTHKYGQSTQTEKVCNLLKNQQIVDFLFFSFFLVVAKRLSTAGQH